MAAREACTHPAKARRRLGESSQPGLGQLVCARCGQLLLERAVVQVFERGNGPALNNFV